MRTLTFLVAAATMLAGLVGSASAAVPLLNANCPTGIEVHADDGGPIYINGSEAKLKRFNDNSYEARLGAVTLSLTIRPDGSPDLSYTRRGVGHGVCRLAQGDAGSSSNRPPNSGRPGGSFPMVMGRPPMLRGVSTGSMPAFCTGQASLRFGVRPNRITSNMAFKSGDRYVVQGHFDQDGDGTKFFNCWFGLDGNFQSVN